MIDKKALQDELFTNYSEYGGRLHNVVLRRSVGLHAEGETIAWADVDELPGLLSFLDHSEEVLECYSLHLEPIHQYTVQSIGVSSDWNDVGVFLAPATEADREVPSATFLEEQLFTREYEDEMPVTELKRVVLNTRVADFQANSIFLSGDIVHRYGGLFIELVGEDRSRIFVRLSIRTKRLN